MNNLEKLENKVDKLNEEETINFVTEAIKVSDTDKIDNEKLLKEIQRNYRLMNNCNRREERKLNFIEKKLDKILELLENEGLDAGEIKRLKEIKELEQKLSRLKGV